MYVFLLIHLNYLVQNKYFICYRFLTPLFDTVAQGMGKHLYKVINKIILELFYSVLLLTFVYRGGGGGGGGRGGNRGNQHMGQHMDFSPRGGGGGGPRGQGPRGGQGGPHGGGGGPR